MRASVLVGMYCNEETLSRYRTSRNRFLTSDERMVDHRPNAGNRWFRYRDIDLLKRLQSIKVLALVATRKVSPAGKAHPTSNVYCIGLTRTERARYIIPGLMPVTKSWYEIKKIIEADFKSRIFLSSAIPHNTEIL